MFLLSRYTHRLYSPRLYVLIGGSTIEKRARHQHALLRSQEPGKVFRIFLSNFVVFCFFKKCLHILSHRRGKENLADYKYQNREDQNPSDARSNALRSTHTKEGEKRRAAGRWNSISTWRCWVTGKKCDCSRSSVCRPVGKCWYGGFNLGKSKVFLIWKRCLNADHGYRDRNYTCMML